MSFSSSGYINSNVINKYMSGYTGSHYGINVEYSDDITVGYNEISVSQQGTPTSISLNQRGIQVKETKNARITENTLHNAGTGIWKAGSCLKTTYTCNLDPEI